MRLQLLQLALQLHELPLISGYLELGLDVLVTGSTLGQIVNSIDEGRVETIPEGKTELEAIWIPSLLNKHPEGVNIFVENMLSLPKLVLIPQRERELRS